MPGARKLKAAERDALIETLLARFDANMSRHPALSWQKVHQALEKESGLLWSLSEMETTGGEPDAIGYDKQSGKFVFADCSPQSPAGRRSLCYDREALASRKKHPPRDNALDVAAGMGVEILTEAQYRELQQLGEFDTKTSSWIRTPAEVRELGGALFCDRRYGQVFTYHNGADSYYAARGFRAMLRI